MKLEFSAHHKTSFVKIFENCIYITRFKFFSLFTLLYLIMKEEIYILRQMKMKKGYNRNNVVDNAKG